MANAQQPNPTRPSLKTKAEHFWQRVSEGLEVHQLWSQLAKDARSSYRLYSAGIGDREAGQSRGRRAWYMCKTLFWAVIEMLSPARRVLLLLGLILLFLPAVGFTVHDKAGEVHMDEFDLHVWGGLLILAVLLPRAGGPRGDEARPRNCQGHPVVAFAGRAATDSGIRHCLRDAAGEHGGGRLLRRDSTAG